MRIKPCLGNTCGVIDGGKKAETVEISMSIAVSSSAASSLISCCRNFQPTTAARAVCPRSYSSEHCRSLPPSLCLPPSLPLPASLPPSACLPPSLPLPASLTPSLRLPACLSSPEFDDPKGQRCERFECVSLGSGETCNTDWLCFTGSHIHDCHSTTIARRALKRFLLKQLLLFFSGVPEYEDRSIFQRSPDSPLLRLKPGVYLHLYTNRIPRGAAQCSLTSPFKSGPSLCSRLCKAGLYSAFRAVAKEAGRQELLDLPSYRDAKIKADLYQKAKQQVSHEFISNNAGPWNSKQIVDNFSI
ncbi:UNVERIFIED_CONTAM: hypothetical protein FKN15_056037 [Acipenser sinensis]